jgi:hypothetical protein
MMKLDYTTDESTNNSIPTFALYDKVIKVGKSWFIHCCKAIRTVKVSLHELLTGIIKKARYLAKTGDMRNAHSYLDGKSVEMMTPVEPKKAFNRTQRKREDLH